MVPYMVAAVRLSGMMEECSTPADLRAAVEHTMDLVLIGTLDTMQWAMEGRCVETEMEAWYARCNDDLTRIAESN